MKTCDVCKRTDKEADALEGIISSVTIGTDIQVARIPLAPDPTTGMLGGPRHECPVECELCSNCIVKVNDSIAAHLQGAFGLRIRK